MSDGQFLELGAFRLHYRIDGCADAPWLVMSNSLGTDLQMWDPQLPALTEHFRVLRYDTRGHGQSTTPTAECSIADLANDVLALLDHLNIAQAHFCGLSLGGMTGMWLAAHNGSRFARVALCNTSPDMAPPSAWQERIKLVTQGGTAAVTDGLVGRWFTPGFRTNAPDRVAIVRQMILETSSTGYIACCAAIRDMDQRASLASITNPTMVIAGSHDPATPPKDGQLIAQSIPHARYVELDAAHLSNYEQPERFSASLCDFLLETN